jgi:hypothetical protein
MQHFDAISSPSLPPLPPPPFRTASLARVECVCWGGVACRRWGYCDPGSWHPWTIFFFAETPAVHGGCEADNCLTFHPRRLRRGGCHVRSMSASAHRSRGWSRFVPVCIDARASGLQVASAFRLLAVSVIVLPQLNRLRPPWEVHLRRQRLRLAKVILPELLHSVPQLSLLPTRLRFIRTMPPPRYGSSHRTATTSGK